VTHEFDPDIMPIIRKWFSRYSSIQFANYLVADDSLAILSAER